MNHQEKTTEDIIEAAVNAMSNSTALSTKVDLTAVTRTDENDPGIDINNFTEDDKQREIFLFRHLEVVGYQVLVRMFKAPTKLASGLIITTNSTSEQDFHEYIGLVVGISPIAYTLPRYNGCEPWAKVGDWVIIPRAFANVRTYKGRKIAWVTEDHILGKCRLADIRNFSER